MTDITLQQIGIFLTVAEHLNLSEAAKELFINQSAVSRWIQRLEVSLNTKLFVRNNRGVELTPDGEFLYSELRPIYSVLSSALQSIRSLYGVPENIVCGGRFNTGQNKERANMNQDENHMREAIRLSELAVIHGNEPFGAVLVKDGEIVYSNENQIYTGSDPTFHAETGLLRRFCTDTGITDLREYTLYSSCEPCFMCCGTMVWTKLGRLVYGASDIDLCGLLGATGAECCRIVFENSAWEPSITSGVLRDESLEILARYFKEHAKG